MGRGAYDGTWICTDKDSAAAIAVAMADEKRVGETVGALNTCWAHQGTDNISEDRSNRGC